MKTKLLRRIFATAAFLPVLAGAQDLVPGMNASYTPPSGCSNVIEDVSIDICNNDQSVAANGPFIVSVYLYDSGSGNHWCVGSLSVNSVSAAACLPVVNWDIDMAQAPVVPPPGNYKLGIWVDTANDVSESDESNNAGLVSSSADIQVCAVNGIGGYESDHLMHVYPLPAGDELFIEMRGQEAAEIKIYNVSGGCVLDAKHSQAGTCRLDVAALPPGMYQLQVTSGGITSNERVVIAR